MLMMLSITALTVCQSLSSDVEVTASPSPPPSPLSNPERGDYNVTNNGTACLMARMGLQLNMTYLSRSQGKVLSLFPTLKTSRVPGLLKSTNCFLYELNFVKNVTSSPLYEPQGCQNVAYVGSRPNSMIM